MSGYIKVPFNSHNSDETVKFLTYFQLTYGVPSLMLMILMFFYIGHSKNCLHSFYRLVRLDLLTNIFCYLNTWIGIRIESESAFIFTLEFIESLLPGFMTWSKFFCSWFFHMQFCSALLLAVHRLISVVINWNNQTTPRFYVFLGIACAIYSFLPLTPFIIESSISVEKINETLWKIYNSDQIYILRIENAGFSITYFVLMLSVGLTTAYKVNLHFRTVNVSDNGLTKKLTKIALTNSFIFTGILFYNLIMGFDPFFHFLPAPYTKINDTIMTFVSDMMTLAMPYILLIFDSNIRNGLFSRDQNHHAEFFVSTTRSRTF